MRGKLVEAGDEGLLRGGEEVIEAAGVRGVSGERGEGGDGGRCVGEVLCVEVVERLARAGRLEGAFVFEPVREEVNGGGVRDVVGCCDTEVFEGLLDVVSACTLGVGGKRIGGEGVSVGEDGGLCNAAKFVREVNFGVGGYGADGFHWVPATCGAGGAVGVELAGSSTAGGGGCW